MLTPTGRCCRLCCLEALYLKPLSSEAFALSSRFAGSTQFAVKNQHFTAVGDALTQCRFVSERGFGGMLNDNYPRLINSVTGWNLSLEDVERIGERIVCFR